jgi:hypothetical protein
MAENVLKFRRRGERIIAAEALLDEAPTDTEAWRTEMAESIDRLRNGEFLPRRRRTAHAAQLSFDFAEDR